MNNDWFHQWIWAGEYPTIALRQQLDLLSTRTNAQLERAIAAFNGPSEYPRVVFVSPEALGVYDGKRFCEPGSHEPLHGSDQVRVAFFYDDGYDDIPGPPFHLPTALDGAPGNWVAETYNSATCSDTAGPFTSIWTSDLLCDVSKAIANGTLAPQSVRGFDDEATVAQNPDGSVTITVIPVKFAKMFHGKTRVNQRIAQVANAAFRRN